MLFFAMISPIVAQQASALVWKQTGRNRYETSESRSITAVAVVTKMPAVASVIIDGKTLNIPQDHEVEGFQYFLSLPASLNVSGNIEVNVSDTFAQVYFINSGKPPAIRRTSGRTDNPCIEIPSSVSQQEWRQGLASPDYDRSFHEVRHLIVHHSAGSNTNTDYTQVVRDIYLYHTEVNGWSDIGYNFLIAQDGTLYAGRDPGNGDQSKVRGAHFCGANTYTLGICLLGNFETAMATDQALLMLEDLLLFETINNDIDPLASRMHSTGDLRTIAGHRDGCATLCPGENIYGLMNDIREEVLTQSIACSGEKLLDFAFDHEILGVNQTLTLTNRSSGYYEYYWYINGEQQPINQRESSFGVPGTYDLGIIGSTLDEMDSLIIQNAIRVSRFEKEPIVFPNPSSNRKITIDYRPEIKEIVLRDLNGKICYKEAQPEATIILPQSLQPGVYQLELRTTDQKILAEKIILQ